MSGIDYFRDVLVGEWLVRLLNLGLRWGEILHAKCLLKVQGEFRECLVCEGNMLGVKMLKKLN